MDVRVLLEVLPLALGLVVAAAPVLLVPVALATKRAPSAGVLFLAGWVSGVVLVGLTVVLVGDLSEEGQRTPDWWGWVLLVLGALLVGLGVRKWLSRPQKDEAPVAPAWVARIEAMSGGAVFGTGLLLVVANPKNLGLVAAGGAVIVEATAQPAEQAIALIWSTLIGSLGIAVPALLPVVLGERARPFLDAVDRWVTRYATLIVVVVLLVLGVLLLVAGIRDLTGAGA